MKKNIDRNYQNAVGYFSNGNFREVIFACAKVSKDYYPKALLLCYGALFRLQNFATAKQILHKRLGLLLEKNESELDINGIKITTGEIKKCDNAIKEIADNLYEYAQICFDQKRYQEAIFACSSVEKNEPFYINALQINADAHMRLADAHKILHDFQTTQQLLGKRLTLLATIQRLLPDDSESEQNRQEITKTLKLIQECAESQKAIEIRTRRRARRRGMVRGRRRPMQDQHRRLSHVNYGQPASMLRSISLMLDATNSISADAGVSAEPAAAAGSEESERFDPMPSLPSFWTSQEEHQESQQSQADLAHVSYSQLWQN